MNIQIDHGDWGEARREDIQRLLEDVSCQLSRHFSDPPRGGIQVQCRPNEPNPRILYRSSPDQDYVIWLTVQNRDWNKFSYQFSHEFCHILCDYERCRLPANQWFQESLCELASIFTLKQMATTWQTSPPYPNWSDYALSHESYAQKTISRDEHQLGNGVPFPEWYRVNEAKLRADQYQRGLNGLVAVQLLPLFHTSPFQWQSVRHLPNTDEPFDSFLASWRASCPPVHQDFVMRVAEVFGINLTRQR
jgi:hypothetical protein